MNQHFLKKKRSGFTLIELLVVIAIISLLSTVIFSAMSGARTRAYNAKVRLQVKQIKNALFLARNDTTGAFPGVSMSWQCLKASGSCWLGQYTGNSIISTALAPYISSLPLPPNPPYDTTTEMNGGYLYLPNFPGTVGTGGPPGTYLIWAQDGPIPDCKGYYPGAPFQQNYYYCYELIAPLY